MANSTFPQQLDVFPTMQDITISDASVVAQYQAAMEVGNFVLARQLLSSITDSDKKIVTADLLNLINSACANLEEYYLQKWSPAYIVSDTQPPLQDTGDYWIKVEKAL